jgi:cob(I)alamin adenosyltransferase
MTSSKSYSTSFYIRIKTIEGKEFMAVLSQGLVQVYTGDGKGKTTAALGLAWRMLGAGGKAYICQFLKPVETTGGDLRFAERIGPDLVFDRVDQPWDMAASPFNPEHCRAMRQAIDRKLDDIITIVSQGAYDLIILDELVYCLARELADWQRVERILSQRARHVELVLTGRGADRRLIDKADLVSEICPKKHPYQSGIAARRGIEY